MHAFNQSLKYDQRMYQADIAGSISYARALARAKILTEEEMSKMIEGLKIVLQEWEQGKFEIQPDDEDIHTANERRLSELIGSLGGKLHTGRSRNDQVATDMRLWLLSQVDDIEKSLKGLIRVMVERAAKEIKYLMPGYTHLQVVKCDLISGTKKAIVIGLYSVHSLYDGHISSSRTHSPCRQISSVLRKWSLAFPSFLLAAVPWPGTGSRWIGISLRRISASSPLQKIACTQSATVTSL